MTTLPSLFRAMQRCVALPRVELSGCQGFLARVAESLLLILLCLFLALMPGCALPGTRAVLPVSLDVTLPESSTRKSSATVVQLRHHASRSERRAFATGQTIGASDARTVTASVSADKFSAEFPSYSEPAVSWFIPPVPTWPASDILFRTEGGSPAAFILYGRSPYEVRLFQLVPSSGATRSVPSATVSQAIIAHPMRSHYKTNKIKVRITE